MAGKFEAKSLVGGTLGQFEVKSEIARGGMGVVYKGYQPSLDRWVAIKTLPMDLAGDRDLVARFKREAQAMSLLNHANIVQVIDSGQDQGQYYMAMEYVEGPSVKDLLKSETIDTDRIFDIIVQTCEGLDYAHKKSLVHRDIKPANLLYEEKTGVVKIADFGIAHFTKKDEDMLTLTAKDVGMGTMNYMAPEQKVDAANVTSRADLYAIGVIVYEAFTGKLPLGKFKLPSEVNPKLPRLLDQVVSKCLQTEPNDRYTTAGEIKTVLLEAKAVMHDKSISRSIRDRLDRTLTAISPSKGGKCLAVGCLLVIVLGAGGFFGFRFLQKRSARKALETLRPDVDALKKKADELHVTSPAGDEAARVDPNEAPDVQVAQLTKAKKAYEDAIAAAAEERKKKLDALKAGLDDETAVVAKLTTEDGFKANAQKALDDLKTKLAADPVDVSACDSALSEAKRQVKLSQDFEVQVATIKKTVESLPPEKAEEGKALLASLEEPRAKGDVAALNDAITTAGNKLSEILKKPTGVTVVQPTDPNPQRNPSTSPDAMRVMLETANDAGNAREKAQRVLDLAQLSQVDAGKDDFDKANKLLDASKDSKLSTDDAIAKLNEAKGKFDAARAAAVDGLRARVVDAKKEAALAADLAKDDWDRANNDVAMADKADPASSVQASRLGDAITNFGRAKAAAESRANDKFQTKKQDADRERAAAVARAGDANATVQAGVDLLKKAEERRGARAYAEAYDALDGAVKQFQLADRSVPSSARFIGPKESFRLSKAIGFNEYDLDALTAIPRGVVIASGSTLQLRGPGFDRLAESDSGLLPPNAVVHALCPGDNDEVYVSYFANGQDAILRVKVDHSSMKSDRILVSPRGAVFALAYDPRNRFVYAGFKDKKQIKVYSADTGEEKRDAIDVTETMGFARSIAPLKDGSVLVVIQKDSPKEPESSWAFSLVQYRPDGERWYKSGDRDNAPVAVVATGDGFVGVNHNASGTLVAYRSTDVRTAVPVELLPAGAADIARPGWAMRLAVCGNKAWVLDQSEKPNESGIVRARRNRLRVYDLAD